jgi:hypothetical protein
MLNNAFYDYYISNMMEILIVSSILYSNLFEKYYKQSFVYWFLFGSKKKGLCTDDANTVIGLCVWFYTGTYLYCSSLTEERSDTTLSLYFGIEVIGIYRQLK